MIPKKIHYVWVGGKEKPNDIKKCMRTWNKYLKDYVGKISLIIFNLGYLPRANKNITTNHKSTLLAIKKGLKLLNKKGMILVTCYPHKEGKKESSTILNYLNKNKIEHKIYRNTTNVNAPFLIQIKNNLT